MEVENKSAVWPRVVMIIGIHHYFYKRIITVSVLNKIHTGNLAISIITTYFLGSMTSFSAVSWTKFKLVIWQYQSYKYILFGLHYILSSNVLNKIIKFALKRLSVAILNHYVADPKCAPHNFFGLIPIKKMGFTICRWPRLILLYFYYCDTLSHHWA